MGRPLTFALMTQTQKKRQGNMLTLLKKTLSGWVLSGTKSAMPQTTFNNCTTGLTSLLTRAVHMLTLKHPKKLPLKREVQKCQEKTALTEQDQPRRASVSLKKCVLEKVNPANMF